MSTTTSTTEIPRPRPVVNASRIIAGVAAVLGSLPTFLLSFGFISWTAEMIAAYGTFLGVVIASISLVFGLRTEKEVTPGSDPMTNEGTPLVPIADDGFED
ncbi:hypothetical protein LCGC14_3102780 [marine sediment metagenome]|uniref:Uncharacterized protein n=1 Tax=marine sediment metagenome TaxID=412755 RepID=A0A0F8WW54_9ZZZZ